MVSVALNSKHCTNLNLTIDLLMTPYQIPQQPSIQIKLPTHIHLCSISERAKGCTNFHWFSSKTVAVMWTLLSLSKEWMKATNTTILQGWMSKWMSSQCWGFLNWTIMLYAHSASTPWPSVLTLQLGKCLAG